MRSKGSHALGFWGNVIFFGIVSGLFVAMGWNVYSKEQALWKQAQNQALKSSLSPVLANLEQELNTLPAKAQAKGPNAKLGVPIVVQFPQSGPSLEQAAFDHQVLQATSRSWWPKISETLQKPLSPGQTLIVVPFRTSEHVRKEWLALATVRSGITTMAVVDPALAFGAFQTKPTDGSRLSLWTENGKILAHTQHTYVGTEISGSAFWSRIKRSGATASAELFEGESPTQKLPSRLVAQPIVGTPLWIGLEVSATSKHSWRDALHTASWIKLIGSALGLGGLALGCWLFLATRKRSMPLDSASQINATSNESPLTAVASAIQNQVIFTEPVEPKHIQSVLLERPNQTDALEIVQRFETKSRELATRVQDKQLIVGMLTEMAARLCASPTLFFRYRPELQSAVLATDSGFDAGQAPATLSFALDSGAAHKIIECIEGGKVASLSNYEPLGKLLLKRMGIAVFDAWAVTAPGASGTKLLGVLVILQSSVQSAMHFDSLVHMMRTTGHAMQNIYEPDSRRTIKT